MEKMAPVLASAEFSFEFKEPANLPNPMLSMLNASFGYPPPAAPAGTAPTVIVRNVNRSVHGRSAHRHPRRQRPGQVHAGEDHRRALHADRGESPKARASTSVTSRSRNSTCCARASNAAGAHDPLAKERPAGRGKVAGREQDLRNFLGTFNFSGDMVKQPVGTMSGGEKARLVLCMIVWQRPNLLLLDEPTNHLDLATREALGVALNEFEGTVMLVSHDRALLRSVCDEFWLVSRGGIAPFDGDLDDYQRYLLDEAKRCAKRQSCSGSHPPLPARPPRSCRRCARRRPAPCRA
jgi:ATP-binding cassette subfamily F protein 3